VQVMHRLLPSLFLGRVNDAQRQYLQSIVRLYDPSGGSYYFAHKQLHSLYISLIALNTHERIGPSKGLLLAYAQMCLLTGSLGFHRFADFYYERGREVMAKLPDNQHSGYYLATSVYYIGAGKWERVLRDTFQGADVAKRLGDVYEFVNLRMIYISTLVSQGRLDEAFAIAEEVERLATEHHIPQSIVQSNYYLGHIHELRNNLDEALKCAEKSLAALSQLEHTDLLANEPWAYASRIYLRNKMYDNAYAAAENSLQTALKAGITGQWGKNAFTALIEVFLGLRETSTFSKAQPDELMAKAEQALKQLSVLPDTLGKINLAYSRGLVSLAKGKPDAAFALWRKGLKLAQGISAPIHVGKNHLRLAQHLPPNDPEKLSHLQKAESIFKEVKADVFLEQISRLKAQ
jgi:tetratricopeptide (TPR) repeat protein